MYSVAPSLCNHVFLQQLIVALTTVALATSLPGIVTCECTYVSTRTDSSQGGDTVGRNALFTIGIRAFFIELQMSLNVSLSAVCVSCFSPALASTSLYINLCGSCVKMAL